MADRNALDRTYSHSRSEASDAGSSSSKWDQDESVTPAPPVVRPAAATQSSTLPSSSSHSPAAPTLPAVASRAQPASRPALEIHDGLLAINSIHYDNRNVKDVLMAHPDIHRVTIQPEYVLASMVDLIGQFKDISTVTTLKFDVDINASTGPRFNFDAQCGSALANLLAGNASLEKLDLSGQRIFSDLLDDIALGLKQQATLGVLDLTGRKSRPRDLDLHSPDYMGKMGDGIAAIISASTGLSTILASRQSIDDDDAMPIADALRKNTSLKTLVLAENKVAEKGCAAIFDAIRKNKKSALVKLDLSGCKIDIGAAKSLAKLLKMNTTLVNIAIGTVPDTASIKIIHEGLSRNKTLVTLHFHKIEDSDRKYSDIWQQLSVELQNRATRAATQPRFMANASTMSSTAATGNGGSSGKEVG
jgi:hypothetical protein